MTDGAPGALVTQISLLCTATRVVKRHTLHRSLAILNLGAAAIAYHYCLSCHNNLLPGEHLRTELSSD
jgi:hypothetical protein